MASSMTQGAAQGPVTLGAMAPASGPNGPRLCSVCNRRDVSSMSETESNARQATPVSFGSRFGDIFWHEKWLLLDLIWWR